MPGVPVLISPNATRAAWEQAAHAQIANADHRSEVLERLSHFLQVDAAANASGSLEQLKEALTSQLEGIYAEYADQAEFVAYLKRDWEPKLGESDPWQGLQDRA